MLTGTHSEAASYEFTTLTCIPGIIHYNDTKIQLLDLPGIIEGASEGKGRGRQVNTANHLLFLGMLDFFYPHTIS
jgi:ribosome-interacting GTPase 1